MTEQSYLLQSLSLIDLITQYLRILCFNSIREKENLQASLGRQPYPTQYIINCEWSESVVKRDF